MSNKDEPAYPHQQIDSDGHHHATDSGLTKREVFAKAAMQGMLANPHVFAEMSKEKIVPESIKFADALLKELEK